MTEIVLSISTQELCQYQRLIQQLIIEVVDHGIAQPVMGKDVVDWAFDTTSVHWLQKAVRLRYDLELDWISVAMVIDLLQENESLRKQNQCIQEVWVLFLTGIRNHDLGGNVRAAILRPQSLVVVLAPRNVGVCLSVAQDALAKALAVPQGEICHFLNPPLKIVSETFADLLI